VRFSGYAAIFDAPDRGGDIVRKGAFAGVKPGLPLFWQHDPQRRIGTVQQIAEDARGLRVIADVDDGAGIALRAGQGLSFGYRVRACEHNTHRELTDLELIEVSLVSHPMQPRARILAVAQ
jgi:uncharacterized protein